MNCCFDKCVLANKDDSSTRFVSCWLCSKLSHLKCAGLNGSILDKIEQCIGIKWSCWTCRKVVINFSKMTGTARTAFGEMQIDHDRLTKKMDALGKIINCSEYDTLRDTREVGTMAMISPDNGAAAGHNDCNMPADIHCLLPIPSNLNTFASPIPSPTDLQMPSPSSVTAPLEITHSSTIQASTSISKTTAETSCPAISRPRATRSQQLREASAPVSSVPSMSNTSSVISTERSHARRPMINNLRTVLPKKSIFISRLATDTTEADINEFISRNYKPVPEMIIQKFNFSTTRGVASFKILVPDEHFNEIVDESFWPSEIIVHEYLPRQRPRRRQMPGALLPSSSGQQSKN